MNSAIYIGSVWHHRRVPVEHRFGYPYFFFGLDLGEAAALNRLWPWLGYERAAVYAVRGCQYLDPGPEPLLAKFAAALARAGLGPVPPRVLFFTMPSYFGHGFNPVSFYAGFDACDRLCQFVAEVHNTFGEFHFYPLVPSPPSAGPASFRFPKEFYVSPFMSQDHDYVLGVEFTPGQFRVTVDMYRAAELTFSAGFAGAARPFSRRTLAGLLCRCPLTPWLTMLLIHLQALRLAFGKGLRYYPHLAPTSPRTVRRGANGWIPRGRARLMRALFRAVPPTPGAVSNRKDQV